MSTKNNPPKSKLTRFGVLIICLSLVAVFVAISANITGISNRDNRIMNESDTTFLNNIGEGLSDYNTAIIAGRYLFICLSLIGLIMIIYPVINNKDYDKIKVYFKNIIIWSLILLALYILAKFLIYLNFESFYEGASARETAKLNFRIMVWSSFANNILIAFIILSLVGVFIKIYPTIKY